MVNISKNELPPEKQNALFTELSQCIGKLNAAQAPVFLTALLGPEEQVMLAKRLVGIILLAHGKSVYIVSQHLHLSTATVSKLHHELQKGTYDHLLDILQARPIRYADLLNTIDSILHFGGILPHYGDTRFKRRR